MSTTRYYYARTDDYGVLTVDRIDYDESEAYAAELAEEYPDAIYFAVEPPPPPTVTIEPLVCDHDECYIVTGRDHKVIAHIREDGPGYTARIVDMPVGGEANFPSQTDALVWAICKANNEG